MRKLIVKLLIKALTKSLTMYDVKLCEQLQEFVECKVFDFVAGADISEPEEYSDLFYREAIRDLTELTKYSITL